MRKLNIAKKSNIRCNNCKHFTRYSKSTRVKNPYGKCDLLDKDCKYWSKCDKFIWKDKYLGITGKFEESKDGNFHCRRCKRVLTDKESIARGFGEECYNKYIKEIIKKNKRLF